MKMLALLTMALTLTGCAALNTKEYGDCMLPRLPDLTVPVIYPVQAVVCTAIHAARGPRDRTYAPPPADPTAPLPAPLAEHPPVTAAD